MESLPSIAGELAGKHVFVTGGSGFMGKVLVEKLLRSCPEVECIYLLLRPKRGVSAQDRVEQIVKTPLFGPLLSERPSATAKLRAVAGDCSQLRLGLSADDEALLVDNVSYVFHAAATVRFDDPLQSAILLNTRGTREVVELCKRMPRLQVLQYVSTTYCFTKEPVLKERAYRAHLDWRTMIRIAETEDKGVLDAVTHKVLDYQPNTYTLTKALAENVINDARNDIPVMIYRPAVVISSLQEPIPGWLDNMNGPFGIWIGACKGVLRFSWGDPKVALSYTPVDWAIRAMIILAVAKATRAPALETNAEEVDVVHLEGSGYDRSTYGLQRDTLPSVLKYAPNAIRYPRYHIGRCYVYYWLGTMLSQVSYGLAIDCILRLSGQKPRLTGMYRKIFYTNQALAYFMMNEFPIETQKANKVHNALRHQDKSSFGLDITDPSSGLHYDRETCMRETIQGAFQYVLKETGTTEKNLKRLQRLYVLEVVMNILWCFVMYFTVGRFLIRKIYYLLM
ncbi:fatty acyl-CoA reductase wat isoform X2 [Frankliniella occidentalis]|uniref:Fatty acyl-CoA reductase n=1 Tax=Frankliniella occidentalis TaxID=133901 RepID=A0A6J1T8W4_FRAOC|nr:fatty acyl-CoA reductase wat isoform X1 [Frankliniella occidentalis]XP_052125199.1 fatty acyl-CoA reductase wat isoform X2 [Frankliniella occidentalis]